MPINNNDESSNAISLQIEAVCSIKSLTRFLHKISSSNIPTQINNLQIIGDYSNPGKIRFQAELITIWIDTGDLQI